MYNKKKQKAKFKFRVELLVILASIAIMITLSIVLRLPDAKTKIADSYTAYGSSLTSDHVYEEISFSELYKLKDDENYTFVYFGSPECGSCVSEITNINTAALKWDIELVYYVDATDYLIDEDADDYVEDTKLTAKMNTIEENLNKNVSTDVSSISLEFTPAIWVFKNGELVFNSGDYLNDDEDGMTLTWSLIADKAFHVNLPEYQD